MAEDRRFIIEIRSKGFQKAKRGLVQVKQDADKLAASTKVAAGQTRSHVAAMNNASGAGATFRREMSALRNNMLLVSFAIAGVTATIGTFVRAAAEFEKVRIRLIQLTGSTKAAAEAFAIFNQVAAKTPYNIQQVASAGAQLEAFGIDSKATITLLTDLAAFMQRDIPTAAFAMGRAFSAGAAASEIFREAGVLNIIRTSQDIQDLTDLTLPEFRLALFKTLVDPATPIAQSAKRLSESYEGMMSTLADATFTFKASVGEKMIPTLKIVIAALTRFVEKLDSGQITRFAIDLVALTATLKIMSVGW